MDILINYELIAIFEHKKATGRPVAWGRKPVTPSRNLELLPNLQKVAGQAVGRLELGHRGVFAEGDRIEGVAFDNCVGAPAGSAFLRSGLAGGLRPRPRL